ncbi:hypothetical protein ID855_16135 [Xenorhabdus sp. ZM]|uniref:hypothetical protein n=1 Tax=Xenorhabdus szentirmaii TaxID=290112 RepID=UPI0019C714E9|nr:hypothetical protein [Xenorhabdus sp. ZM]MBD2806196.1 hypothetical protein [Xenorhabdus sp. ZM]
MKFMRNEGMGSIWNIMLRVMGVAGYLPCIPPYALGADIAIVVIGGAGFEQHKKAGNEFSFIHCQKIDYVPTFSAAFFMLS